jgi:hypothetical protein
VRDRREVERRRCPSVPDPPCSPSRRGPTGTSGCGRFGHLEHQAAVNVSSGLRHSLLGRRGFGRRARASRRSPARARPRPSCRRMRFRRLRALRPGAPPPPGCLRGAPGSASSTSSTLRRRARRPSPARPSRARFGADQADVEHSVTLSNRTRRARARRPGGSTSSRTPTTSKRAARSCQPRADRSGRRPSRPVPASGPSTDSSGVPKPRPALGAHLDEHDGVAVRSRRRRSRRRGSGSSARRLRIPEARHERRGHLLAAPTRLPPPSTAPTLEPGASRLNVAGYGPCGTTRRGHHA